MIHKYENYVKEGCFLCGTSDFEGQVEFLELKTVNGKSKRYEREYILCDECAKKFSKLFNSLRLLRKK